MTINLDEDVLVLFSAQSVLDLVKGGSIRAPLHVETLRAWARMSSWPEPKSVVAR